MNKKSIIIIAVIAVAVVIVTMYMRNSGTKTKEYYWRTATIDKGDVSEIVTATGSMAADTSVDIGVQVSGVVAKINVDYNDMVKKGQVIAILDTTLYYAAKVDAEAILKRTQVLQEQAKREYERTKNLFENKVAAQAEYDLAFTNYETAKSNVISARAQLNRAAINLRYCTITSPISGMVIARNVQVGNMVIASFNSPLLFTIAYDLKKMQVQANVDEADIGLLKVGQQAKFTVDAYPDEVFAGTVSQIRHQPVMVQNVVNYVVIIEVENPDLKLMPGLTANSNILIQERKNVLRVSTNALAFTPPLEYIQDAKELPDSVKKFWMKKINNENSLKRQQIVDASGVKDFLWVKKGADVFPVEVVKGLNDGSFTEITGAVKEEDEVATGINQNPSATDAAKTSNPFIPKFPSRNKK